MLALPHSRRHGIKLRCVASAMLLATASAGWAGCSVSAPGVSFGDYNPFSSQPTDSAGYINVVCTVSTPYTLALSAGNGSYAARVMSNGGQQLVYNLYTDAGRNSVWGDSIGGGSASVTGSGLSASHTVYGRIRPLQNVSAGSYVDSIMVTLEF